MVISPPPTGNTVVEMVKCTIYDSSRWTTAEYHVQQLAQNGAYGSYTDNTLTYAGPGYYQSGHAVSPTPPSPAFSSGNYNLWVICSGPDYYNNTWYASTGGTLGTF